MAFFKRKTKEEPVKSLKAFVPGKVISITEVNDPVFSSKALGDGIAIQPAAQVITAPCDGVISMIAEESNHAIGMTLNNGVELLLHIGLDTVSLNGEGFCVFVKANDKVKQGDKLMEFDKALIESKGFETTCILVVTNSDDYPDTEYLSGMEAVQNETEICKF
ncbi:MAG: PTS glucose transporter subunit IIA [Eubacteriales bacterium]|nr:PTS glucose transporter subunit IIA [Eubacteriales bacterium]